MKTFIVISVFVIGFFFYLFFFNTQTAPVKTPKEEVSKLMEENQTAQIELEVESYTTLSKEAPKAIPEEQTFDTIKSILLEVSGKQTSTVVMLNSNINSFLYTKEQKESFKQKICRAFNLTYDEVDAKFRKNRLVWDWVNYLKE